MVGGWGGGVLTRSRVCCVGVGTDRGDGVSRGRGGGARALVVGTAIEGVRGGW